VTCHSGLLLVYADADSDTALAVFQFPSAAMLPLILTVCPYVVVLSSLKVTATEVALAQAVLVFEVELIAAVEDVVLLTLQIPPPLSCAVG
jgi:hypothetical protein